MNSFAYLQDLSTNGTIVDGKFVNKSIKLTSGSEIEVCDVCIAF